MRLEKFCSGQKQSKALERQLLENGLERGKGDGVCADWESV